LISPNHEEYEYMCDIIKDRIEEGQGETIYENNKKYQDL
jgi:hypothetical protein